MVCKQNSKHEPTTELWTSSVCISYISSYTFTHFWVWISTGCILLRSSVQSIQPQNGKTFFSYLIQKPKKPDFLSVSYLWLEPWFLSTVLGSMLDFSSASDHAETNIGPWQPFKNMKQNTHTTCTCGFHYFIMGFLLVYPSIFPHLSQYPVQNLDMPIYSCKHSKPQKVVCPCQPPSNNH